MERPIEETLQAYLDSELPAAEVGALEARVAADEDVRRRLEMLRAAKAALEETAVPAVMPDDLEARVRRDLEDEPGQPPRAVRRRVALWVGASLAAAAALLIAVVLLKTDGAREPAPESDREAKQQQQPTPTDDKVYTGGSRNDWLVFRVVKEARPAELFDDPVITLETEAQQGFGVLCLLPWRPGETLGSVAERMVQKEILTPPKTGLLPVAISAEITAPSGRVYEGRLAFPENPSMTIMNVMNGGLTIKAKKASWTLRLSQILVRTHAPLPYFALLPDGKGGWITDQRRAYDRIPGHRKLPQEMTDLRWERFFPDEHGRYSVKFQLHTLPAQKKYGWPEFEKPLRADVSFPVTGVTGKWSKPENGLSFRLAAPRRVWRKGESVPIALQIRNDAVAPRKYNFMGTTGAEIPRPYHFQLFLDDETEPASFRFQEHGGFIFFGEYGFARHTPGTTRTVVFPLECWRYGDRPLTEMPGRHTLSCRFHFRPFLWDADDKEIWLGKVDVPGIEFEVRAGDGAEGQRDGGAK